MGTIIPLHVALPLSALSSSISSISLKCRHTVHDAGWKRTDIMAQMVLTIMG